MEKLTSNQLSPLLDRVKRNLLVDYGEYGMHLPDVDLVIIDPVDGSVLFLLLFLSNPHSVKG
jgi:type II restriction enzyme